MKSINHLHLFSKDTSATATERGFQYQRLLTVENWLTNRLNFIPEKIYCDYQEDIFSVNRDGEKYKFQQIKSYSENFSFSKKEITKTLFNFFMLWAKYHEQTTQFWFVTNSSIARRKKSNDSDILSGWVQHQENISAEMMEQIVNRVRSIVDSQIMEAYDQIKDVDNDNPFAAEAIQSYKDMSESDWIRFISSIRWHFEDLSPEQSLEAVRIRIIDLIFELPIVLDRDKALGYLSILHYYVSECTTKENPEERVLVNMLVDVLILREGDQKARWYTFILAKPAALPLTRFYADEFYEIVDAIRFFGFNFPRSGHQEHWLSRLEEFIRVKDTPIQYKRKAIWTKFWIHLIAQKTDEYLAELFEAESDDIHYYFENVGKYIDKTLLKDDTYFLEALRKAVPLMGRNITAENISVWFNKMDHYINENLEKGSIDDQCLLIEILGFSKIALHEPPMRFTESIAIHKKILPLLKQHHRYDIRDLLDHYDGMVDVAVFNNLDKEILDDVAMLFIEFWNHSRNQINEIELGKKLYHRAGNMRSSDINYQALKFANDALALFKYDISKRERIATLLEISHIYMNLRLNYAAKFYALNAMYTIHYDGRATEFDFLSDTLLYLLRADYQQGQWTDFIKGCSQFFVARTMMDNKNNLDKHLRHLDETNTAAHYLGTIFVTYKYFNPELENVLSEQLVEISRLLPDLDKKIIEPLKNFFDQQDSVVDSLKKTVDGIPFLEVGRLKSILLNILGIEWILQGYNELKSNALLEEIAAYLQIILLDMAESEVDLHLAPVSVVIHLRADSAAQEETTLVEWNLEKRHWLISIQDFSAIEKNDNSERLHFVVNSILQIINDLSFLPKGGDGKEKFDTIMKKQKTEFKLSHPSYEFMYRRFLSKSEVKFKNISELPKTNATEEMLELNAKIHNTKFTISKSLDEELVKSKIAAMYARTTKRLSLSIQQWQKDPVFGKLVASWRTMGYLDWQILLSMENFVLDARANKAIENRTFASVDESVSALNTELIRILGEPPQDDSQLVGIKEFQSADFAFYIIKKCTDEEVLDLYTLRRPFPPDELSIQNAAWFRIYLMTKFKYAEIDLPHLSPFRNEALAV